MKSCDLILKILIPFLLLLPARSWADDQPMGAVSGAVLANSSAGTVSNITLTALDQSTTNNYHNHVRNRCDLNKLSNVPNTEAYYQEREKEINDIEAQLENDKNRVKMLCIVGFSGSGKTQLAREYARIYAKKYHHTRFFDAESRQKLLKNFECFAISLCHEDLGMCADGGGFESCVFEIVNRCLKEISGDFLWIFDNAKRFEDIEKFIPNIQGISGVILVTTQSNGDFASIKNLIDLNGGMTKQESCALLNKTVQVAAKLSDISSICSAEEIREIAVNTWHNLPLPMVYTGEIINTLGSCKEYIEKHRSYPDRLNSLAIDFRHRLQEEAISEQIRCLDRMNLDIVGLLSFMDTPFSTRLVTIYICSHDEYRKNLKLDKDIPKSYQDVVDQLDKIKIGRAINNLNLVKKNGEYLLFPHELFRAQVQNFLSERDQKDPGSYKRCFDHAATFLCRQFSGCFWSDQQTWYDERDLVLNSVKRMVDTFMKNVDNDRGEFTDDQLTLWYRLAKYYTQNNPSRSVELFGSLLKQLMSNQASQSEYLKNSPNHAAITHGLAVAICQQHYHSNDGDLAKAETSAQTAYTIFRKNFGKNDPRTLNAYLVLLHIKLNLKSNVSIKQSNNVKKDNLVRFLGEEPVIYAALELTGLLLGSENFDKLSDELSYPKKSKIFLNESQYHSIYNELEKKLEEKSAERSEL